MYIPMYTYICTYLELQYLRVPKAKILLFTVTVCMQVVGNLYLLLVCTYAV